MSARRALAALACLALVACGPGDEASTPEGAVRSFARAADPRPAGRDRERVFALIGPRTRARLEEGARLASRQAGARRPFEWKDMLVVGMARPRFELQSVRTITAGPERAEVEVRGAGGEREVVQLVREGGTWKLELPEPPPDPPAGASAPASQTER